MSNREISPVNVGPGIFFGAWVPKPPDLVVRDPDFVQIINNKPCVPALILLETQRGIADRGTPVTTQSGVIFERSKT